MNSLKLKLTELKVHQWCVLTRIDTFEVIRKSSYSHPLSELLYYRAFERGSGATVLADASAVDDDDGYRAEKKSHFGIIYLSHIGRGYYMVGCVSSFIPFSGYTRTHTLSALVKPLDFMCTKLLRSSLAGVWSERQRRASKYVVATRVRFKGVFLCYIMLTSGDIGNY